MKLVELMSKSEELLKTLNNKVAGGIEKQRKGAEVFIDLQSIAVTSNELKALLDKYWKEKIEKL